MRTAQIMALMLGACVLMSAPQASWAKGRSRTETRSNVPQYLLPAAVAPQALIAPVLTGLDYSAVAPPGVRLRVVEDEPYTYALSTLQGARIAMGEGVTGITLHAETPAVDTVPIGSFEARVSLRLAGQNGINGPLAASFDAAAHSAYRHAMLRQEQRGAVVYGIDEVRSPLGLTNARDCTNGWREYLAYSAAAINPNSDEGAARHTPYQYLRGELRVLRLIDKRECLLSITIEATEFPHALTLTENIARCIINRLVAQKNPKQRLDYLAYYPEAERALLFDNEVLDPRTADLSERPGEGCGVAPQPIQGDVCPKCVGDGPFWPARPYADNLYIQGLSARIADAVCSHCLLEPADAVGGTMSTTADGKNVKPAGCGCCAADSSQPDLSGGATACGKTCGDGYQPEGWFE